MLGLIDRVVFGAVSVAAFTVLAAPAQGSIDPGFEKQWGLKRIGAPEAWAAGTGKGTVIATVDSGVDLHHEDLKGQILQGQGRDYVDGDSQPQDGDGHGTHVAGVAAAATGNGKGVAGVAPGAKILPIRIFDDDGRAREGFAAPIRWATNRGVDVINVSAGTVTQGLGQDEALFGPEFREAIEFAWSKGVIVVVAAGNDFLLSSGYAEHPAIVVSATDRNDAKPDFSSGVGRAKWGIAAPGGSGTTDAIENDIYSTYSRNRYAYLRGTSMAAPHVAGAAAVLRGLGLGPRETIDRLLSTAKDVGPKGNDSTFGHGRIDLAAAVRGLEARPDAPASGPDAPGGVAAGDATPLGIGEAPTAETEALRDGRTGDATDRSALRPGSPRVAKDGARTDAQQLRPDGNDQRRGRSPIIVIGVIAGAAAVGTCGYNVWRRRPRRPNLVR